GIQGAYQPSVQASLPFLLEKEDLLKGNAIVNQVSALSNLIGPIIGGLLYGSYGLMPILVCSIVCFIGAVIMEMIMKIPYVKSKSEDKALNIVKNDIRESVSFITKEKPVLLKSIIIISLFNLFLTSMIIVGIPVIIRVNLEMSSSAYGITQGALALGGLVGGILTGVLGKKLNIKGSYKLLMLDSVALIPMGIILMGGGSNKLIYIVTTACCFMIMVVGTMFSIQMLSFIQGETPGHLIGKVISFCLSLAMCAQPIGQILYGYLFEVLNNNVGSIVLGAAIVSGIIGIMAKGVFEKIEDRKIIEEMSLEGERI
ncbi:MAG: MFS transporter, partial [Sarcina sp.]